MNGLLLKRATICLDPSRQRLRMNLRARRARKSLPLLAGTTRDDKEAAEMVDGCRHITPSRRAKSAEPVVHVRGNLLCRSVGGGSLAAAFPRSIDTRAVIRHYQQIVMLSSNPQSAIRLYYASYELNVHRCVIAEDQSNPVLRLNWRTQGSTTTIERNITTLFCCVRRDGQFCTHAHTHTTCTKQEGVEVE